METESETDSNSEATSIEIPRPIQRLAAAGELEAAIRNAESAREYWSQKGEMWHWREANARVARLTMTKKENDASIARQAEHAKTKQFCRTPPTPDAPRARKVTATITARIYSHDPAQIDITAKRRQDALRNWLKRHRKDIENEMSQLDEIEIDVQMGYIP